MADNLTTQRQLSEKNSWFGHEWGGLECKICSWSLICLSISRFIPSGLSLVSFLSNWFFIIIIIIIFQLKSWYSPTQSTWKPIQTYSLAGKIQGLWQLHTSMQCVNLVRNKWIVWYFGMWHIFAYCETHDFSTMQNHFQIVSILLNTQYILKVHPYIISFFVIIS